MNSLPFYNSPVLNQSLMWLAQTYFIPYYRSQSDFHNCLEVPYLNANFYHDTRLRALSPFQQLDNAQSLLKPSEKSPDNPKKIPKTKKKSSSKAKPVNKMFKSFADLVDKAADLWLNRLTENRSEDILNTITEQLLKCEQNTDLMMWNSQEMPMCQGEDEDIQIFLKKEAEEIANNNFNRISSRKINKIPKAGKDNWTRKDDSRLLSLVEELGQDWIQISGAFEESFVTPKYLQERYQAFCNKKLGFKHQKSLEHENLDITSSYGFNGDNWDIPDRFVGTQTDDAFNDFCMMIRDMTFELDGPKGSYPTGDIEDRFESVDEGFWQESKEDRFEAFEEMINSMHLQVTREGSSSSYFEARQEKVQEDTIDLYFNTNNSEEIEQTLLKNKDFLEKVNLCEDSEEIKERTSPFTSPVQPEEEGIVGERFMEEKPKEEVIEILNGRVSLIQSLIEQTRIELMKLQSEARNNISNHIM